ncbi:unnamed protein product, partial [marine sediment metagenome]
IQLDALKEEFPPTLKDFDMAWLFGWGHHHRLVILLPKIVNTLKMDGVLLFHVLSEARKNINPGKTISREKLETPRGDT